MTSSNRETEDSLGREGSGRGEGDSVRDMQRAEVQPSHGTSLPLAGSQRRDLSFHPGCVAVADSGDAAGREPDLPLFLPSSPSWVSH